MKMMNVRTKEVAPAHRIGSTRNGNAIYINPGPMGEWRPIAYSGYVALDKDNNFINIRLPGR